MEHESAPEGHRHPLRDVGCRCSPTTTPRDRVKVRHNGRTSDLSPARSCSRAAALNPTPRCRALHGPGWELAKVRGTRYNTGGGIRWRSTSRHAVWPWSRGRGGWDYHAPPFGDLSVATISRSTAIRSHHGHARGERFVDEGFDFRNYTTRYATSSRISPT